MKLQVALLFSIIYPFAIGQISSIGIMVATGQNVDYLNHTEVINIKTLTSCSNLPSEYPVEVALAIPMQYNSKMVICGGWSTGDPYTYISGDCYIYSNDSWII